MRGGPPRVLRTMLDGLIDYAGLFPPASQSLDVVAQNYAAYRRSRKAWMLGRLVLPAARLPEFSATADAWLPTGDGVVPWRIAAIVGANWDDDMLRVEDFNARHSTDGRALVDTVELRVATADDVYRATSLQPATIRIACEVPAPTVAADLLDAIVSAGAIAKVRTGGVVADAFPPVEELAAFLWASARRQVAIKATAGLHHAVRGERRLTYEADAPVAAMHGFVNLVMAAAWAYEHARPPALEHSREPSRDVPAPIVELLEARDASRLRVADRALTWGEVTVSIESLDLVRRRFALAIGSCSFEEPVEALKALGWLGA